MYEIEKLERHEYNKEEVSKIVKKKRKTDEEADIAEALHEAEITLPSGKTLRVVTETYHHHVRNKERNETRKNIRYQPGNNKIVPANITLQEDMKRREYNFEQIEFIKTKRSKNEDEEEITAAVQEAERITHSGKVLKVVIETIHNRPAGDEDRTAVHDIVPYKSKRKISEKSKKQTDSVKQNRYDPRDKSYKQIFDKRLLPPLGFYRREDRYQVIREKYDLENDERGVAMTDKYWRRAQNYIYTHLFLWPPPKILEVFFWSYGFYGDYYQDAHRQMVPEDLPHKKEVEYSDSDGEAKDFDDEVFIPIFYSTSNDDVPPRGNCKRVSIYNTRGEPRKKSVYPWGEQQLMKETDLEEFHSKVEGASAYDPRSEKEKRLAELSGRELPTKRIDPASSAVISTEKISYNEMNKYIKLWLHELQMISASKAERLNEAAEKMKHGQWDGWQLRSMLILEYGANVVVDLKNNKSKDKDPEASSKSTVKVDPGKKMIKHKPPGAEIKPKKKIAWQNSGEDVSPDASSTVVPAAEKTLEVKKPLKTVPSPNKATSPSNLLNDVKSSKSISIISGPGEGEKESIGKLRRGTKFKLHDDLQIDECEESSSSDHDDKDSAASPSVANKKGVKENAMKRDFANARIQMVKIPREPNSKEAELWNSLPNNPKLSKTTMLIAPFTKDVNSTDVKEIFPDAAITLERPGGKINVLYAVVKFSTYEECRSAYGTIRKITFDGIPLIAIPKHKTNNIGIGYLKSILSNKQL